MYDFNAYKDLEDIARDILNSYNNDDYYFYEDLEEALDYEQSN